MANTHGSPFIVVTGYEPGGRHSISIFIILETVVTRNSRDVEPFVLLLLLLLLLQTSRVNTYWQQLCNMGDKNGDAAHPRRPLVDCLSTFLTPYS
jgi:hypothetical protein